MVDNENQWEDMEYSEDSGDDVNYASDEDVMGDYSEGDYSDEEYSDEEYESYDDDDEGYEPAPKKQGNAGGCIVVLLLLLLLLGGAVWYFFMKNGGAGEQSEMPQNNQVVQEQMEQPSDESSMDSTTAMGDEFFAQAGGNPDEMMSVDFNAPGEATVTSNNGNEEIVATVMENPEEGASGENIEVSSNGEENQNGEANVEDLFPSESIAGDGSQENNEIMVAYNKKSRQNPFKPPVRSKDEEAMEAIDGAEFEIIEPPTTSVEDENLTKLLQTQISGILFDDVSPSAIVNLNGIDQFVKMGDVISGYTIESITKDKVQINYKNNSYVASVGELFTRGALDKQRAVADLENKFAGRYRNNN